MKTIDEQFIDWESATFGFGYGTGELFTLRGMKDFMACIQHDKRYDYEYIENELGGLSCWLLINILCKADIIEYGTSPRHGWLTVKGKALKDYLDSKTVEGLYRLTQTDQDYIYCGRDYCNCEEKCSNVFF